MQCIRIFPNISNQPKQLDKIGRSEFTLATSGDINCSDIERKRCPFLLNWVDVASQISEK